MEHYLWLFNNQHDDRGLWGACLYSLLLHVIMFAIMATTTIFYPMAGESSKLDIVWLYPSFLMGGDTVPVSVVPPVQQEEHVLPDSTEQHPQKKEEIRPESSREAALIQKIKTAPSPAPSTQNFAETNPELVPPAPQDSPSADEPEMVLPPATSLQRVASAAVKPSKTEPGADKPSPRESPAPASNGKVAVTEKATKLNSGEVQSAEPEKPEITPATSRPEPVKNVIAARINPLQQETPRVTERNEPARNHVPVLQSARGNDAKPAETPSQPVLSPVNGNSGQGSVILQKRVDSSPVAKAIVNEKPLDKMTGKISGTKGIIEPPLTGDLKLEVTATADALKGIKISVTFREFPKERRNRPMLKGEARRFQTLAPKIAKTAGNTLALVIVSSLEGIYEFRNISETADTTEADFRIIIHENSPKPKTKPVGTHKISARGSIAKVMMPEGILWDDETAFSGSLEDSESLTKFNTETGLTWKEYKE